jgi:hypothetical protein
MSARALKAGSMCLYSWSGLNFLLSSLILIIVVFRFGNSPLLAMVFEESAIARLGVGVILALNCLTKSCTTPTRSLSRYWFGSLSGLA